MQVSFIVVCTAGDGIETIYRGPYSENVAQAQAIALREIGWNTKIVCVRKHDED